MPFWLCSRTVSLQMYLMKFLQNKVQMHDKSKIEQSSRIKMKFWIWAFPMTPQLSTNKLQIFNIKFDCANRMYSVHDKCWIFSSCFDFFFSAGILIYSLISGLLLVYACMLVCLICLLTWPYEHSNIVIFRYTVKCGSSIT